jgi:hypothetical protein
MVLFAENLVRGDDHKGASLWPSQPLYSSRPAPLMLAHGCVLLDFLRILLYWIKNEELK